MYQKFRKLKRFQLHRDRTDRFTSQDFDMKLNLVIGCLRWLEASTPTIHVNSPPHNSNNNLTPHILPQQKHTMGKQGNHVPGLVRRLVYRYYSKGKNAKETYEV